MVRHSAGIRMLRVRVPLRSRHFLSLNLRHFHNYICSWVETYCIHFTSKCMLMVSKHTSYPCISAIPTLVSGASLIGGYNIHSRLWKHPNLMATLFMHRLKSSHICNIQVLILKISFNKMLQHQCFVLIILTSIAYIFDVWPPCKCACDASIILEIL